MELDPLGFNLRTLSVGLEILGPPNINSPGPDVAVVLNPIIAGNTTADSTVIFRPVQAFGIRVHQSTLDASANGTIRGGRARGTF